MLVVFGPEIAAAIANRAPSLGSRFVDTWTVLQWPVLLCLVLLTLALVYRYAPDVEQGFRFITPGSVLATVAWLLFSLVFRVYAQHVGSYNKTYGTLAGLALLLLYLYWSASIALLGAEVNQVIEAHAPGGKKPGEKVSEAERAAGPGVGEHRSAPDRSDRRPGLRPGPRDS